MSEPKTPRHAKKPLSHALRTKIRAAFVENAALKFVAFVLALTVFILVQSEGPVYVGVNVGIQYSLPEDRVLVSDLPDSVRVSVKGSRRRLRRFDEGDIDRIHVDLQNQRRPEYVFTEDLVRLPEDIELVRFTPPSISTPFERRVTTDVPIEVQRVGEVPPGYFLTGITTRPARATLSGAESAVSAATAVKTRELSVAGRTSSFEVALELAPPDSFVELLTPESGQVVADVSIIQEQASRQVGPIEVAVRPGPAVSPEAASRFAAGPQRVSVILRGSRLAVDAVDAAELEAYVEISAHDLTVGRPRRARVIVPTPAKGIAVEIVPEEVTVALK